MKQTVSTREAPSPAGPYSQAAIAGGRAIYVAGQVATDPATGKPVPGDFEAQAVRVFENIAAILRAAGASLGDVVKVNVYLADLAHFGQLNDIYRRYFTADFPARTTVQVVLPPGRLLEIDVVAYVP